MPIDNISEINKVYSSAEKQVDNNFRVNTPEGKKCVFDPQIKCSVPNCKLDVCSTCPYGYLYSLSSSVKNIYSKIASMASFLLDRIYSSNKIEDKLIK